MQEKGRPNAVAGGLSAVPSSLRYATTADGWQLALRRYHGGNGRVPVILCPGYGCSGLFLDYDDRHSLARYLARRGFDAWVLDLRARGDSRPIAGAARCWSWTFDDLVRYDLPSAIGLVQAETRRQQVFWIGHSMGGVALYAFVGTMPTGRESVAAAVTIAAPILFPATAWQLLQGVGQLLMRLPLPQTVPQRQVISLLWGVAGITGFARFGMNPENIDRRLAARALRRSLHNVSLAKLRQLTMWSCDQVFCSADRAVDYRAALCRVDVPILVVAGTDDRMAKPASVHLAVEEISSTDCSFLEFGVGGGYSADYGHIDLVLGRHAPEEVFPRIGDWLDERS